jgi:hypothetical protein
MTAPAFTKFDPRAFLENERRGVSPANPAKPSNAQERQPQGPATLASLAALAAQQAEPQNCWLSSGNWTEAEEERAAIAEFDGGASRTWAEALARLDPSKPPSDVPAKRWLGFIDDCGRFLDAGWAECAADIGWEPLDLFGCDRERPIARTEKMGLLWLINGGTVMELSRDCAIVAMGDGVRRVFRRRPVDIGRVALAWELTPT